MEKWTEVRHYLNDRRDFGFTIRMTRDSWGAQLYFECFVITSVVVSDPEEPVYPRKGNESKLYEYFNNEVSSWDTTKIDESQPVITGHFNELGWMGVRHHTPTLYFHDPVYALEYEKLMGRVFTLAREMMPEYFAPE